MQTKCPHCQTIFKVSDEHLKLADGFVRCGICKEVFNALKDEAQKESRDNEQIQPTNDETTGTTDISVEQKVEANNINSGDSDTTDTTSAQNSEDQGANQTISIEDKDSSDQTNETTTECTASDNRAQTDMFSTSSEITKSEDEPAPVTAETTEPEITKTESVEGEIESPVAAAETEAESKEQISNNEQKDNDKPDEIIGEPSASIAPATASASIENVAANIADSTVNISKDNSLFDGVQSKLIPDEYRIPELHNTYSIWQDLAWSMAILILTASLFVEYTWFNRNELISNPQLRPFITQFCSVADCNLMDLREPGEIEMTTRNIYTHPNVKNALMISGTLVNHASFEQAYPNILIDFSDVRGEVIASRTFTPEDYLQIKVTSLRALAPEIPVNFNIEIQDPGKDAMTYEFTFL